VDVSENDRDVKRVSSSLSSITPCAAVGAGCRLDVSVDSGVAALFGGCVPFFRLFAWPLLSGISGNVRGACVIAGASAGRNIAIGKASNVGMAGWMPDPWKSCPASALRVTSGYHFRSQDRLIGLSVIEVPSVNCRALYTHASSCSQGEYEWSGWCVYRVPDRWMDRTPGGGGIYVLPARLWLVKMREYQ